MASFLSTSHSQRRPLVRGYEKRQHHQRPNLPVAAVRHSTWLVLNPCAARFRYIPLSSRTRSETAGWTSDALPSIDSSGSDAMQPATSNTNSSLFERAALQFTVQTRTCLIAFAVAAGTGWLNLPAGACLAAQGEWQSGNTIQSPPAKNRRVSQQSRPASAPTSHDGHAVTLDGTIEACIRLKQPRPFSAVPR